MLRVSQFHDEFFCPAVRARRHLCIYLLQFAKAPSNVFIFRRPTFAFPPNRAILWLFYDVLRESARGIKKTWMAFGGNNVCVCSPFSFPTHCVMSLLTCAREMQGKSCDIDKWKKTDFIEKNSTKLSSCLIDFSRKTLCTYMYVFRIYLLYMCENN